MKKCLLAMMISLLLMQMISTEPFDVESIGSYEAKEFSIIQLAPHVEEYYKIYHFINNIADEPKTDLVLQFKVGQGPTTRVAIYNSLESIHKNDHGEFDQFVMEYTADVKEIIISKSNEKYIGKGDYFIVIYDLKYFYKDIFTIFNEADKIELRPICYLIPHLYSLQKLVFKYTKADEHKYLEFHMTTRARNTPQLDIKAESEETENYLRRYEGYKASEIIALFDRTKDYFFILYAGEGTAQEFDKTFCITFMTKRITVLHNTFQEKQFTSGMVFYYLVDLKPYKINEEGSVVLNFDYTELEAKWAFTGAYATYDEKEDNLMGQFVMDEKDSECAVQKDELMDRTYHLYFKKTRDDWDTLLVLLDVNHEHYHHPYFRIAATERVKEITAKGVAYIKDLSLPKYFMINPNTIPSNVIVFTDKDNIQSIIIGSLANEKQATAPSYHNQIFGVNKSDKDNPDQPLVYIKLYGGIGEVKFETLLVEQKINFLGGVNRLTLTHFIQQNNCQDFMYFIANWEAKSNNFLSIDTIYGKGKVYHLDKFLYGKSLSDMLPNETNSQLVTETKKVKSNVDMMKISCEIPMEIKLNIDMIQEKEPETLKKGDSFKIEMPKDKEIKYDLGTSKDNYIEARIETEESVIQLTINVGEMIILNKNNRIYKGLLPSDPNGISNEEYPIVIKATSPNGSIFAFKYGTLDAYHIIKETTKTTKQDLLIEVKKDSSYYSVDVTIEIDADDSKTMCYESQFNSPQFISLPISNCHLIQKTLTITIDNPYDKYMEKPLGDQEQYYIAIHFQESLTNEVNIIINYIEKESQEILQENTYTLFNSESTPSFMRIAKSADTQKDVVLYTITSCSTNPIDYQLQINKQPVKSGQVSSNMKVDFFNNQLTELQMKLLNQKGLFSYRYATKNDYDKYVEFTARELKTEQGITNKKQLKIQFTPYMKEKVKYELYVVKKDDKNNVLTECDLIEREPLETFENDGKESVIEKTVIISEDGNYYVNVIASQVDGIKTRVSYNSVVYDLILGWGWEWILLIIAGAIALIGGIGFIIYWFAFRQKQTPANTEPFDSLLVE